MDLAGTERPQGSDWYVLGRIAEQLQEPDSALRWHARVAEGPIPGDLDKALCLLLASRRIQALDPRAAAPPETPGRTPSEAECRAYYQSHLERFTTRGSYDCRCILLRPLDWEAPAEAQRQVDQKVAQILAALKAGRRFADLARTWSEDPGGRERGGLYQDIPPGRFPKAFEDAAFTQPLGQVGGPVATPFGTFLILVEKRTPGGVEPYEAVRDQVRRQILEN
jgi:hypothetical protein